MRYRKLVAKDDSPLVSNVGFGCSGLGGIIFGDVSLDEAVDAVKKAIELGINYFDTSPFYGLTNSERVLGRCLKAAGVDREKIVVGTKVGRYGDREFDFSADRVTKCFGESLDRLGLDYVDIILCHDIEFIPDTSQIINETLPALRKLREQGKIKYIGVSGYPLPVLDEIVKKSGPGGVDLILTYCHYNLYDQSAEAYVREWKEKYGVTAINASALGMGLLTDNPPPAWHPAKTELKEAVNKAAATYKAEGKEIAKEALKYALSNQIFSSVLVGIKSSSEVEYAVEVENEVAKIEDSIAIPESVCSLFSNVETTWSSGVNPLGQV
eukprot:TRINITY_DN12042_c0_g1_i1.p1 TRINITY_DN12042_c0_g1~~TRINITY_DN12042_c0_g1_i1.p1  ORF type:complete len:325 (+),score=63.34 TRINITY_DN12042_c0_g1_i1:64-1038(+)